ncbi:MAG: hypothetical protein ACRCT2_02310 [Plesiomonas shigelloides]
MDRAAKARQAKAEQRKQKKAKAAEIAKTEDAERLKREQVEAKAKEEAEEAIRRRKAHRSRPLLSEERCPVHGLMYFKRQEAICKCKAKI